MKLTILNNNNIMNFKKTTLFFALVILLTGSTSSLQGSTLENSLLWRVSGNGLEQSSYLFGTQHLIPVSFLDGVYGWREAFERTEQVVGELDMSNMAELQMQILQHAMMPEGVTYESLLSAEDLALLDSELTSMFGVGLAQLGIINPAALRLEIMGALYQRYFPMTPGESIDGYFQEKAIARSRPIRALDTFESQIYALYGVNTIERQAELLLCMLRHPEATIEFHFRLNELYKAFNISGLYELNRELSENSPCPPTEEEINALTVNRPLRCIDQLSSIIQEKPSFIAVGALHLPGEHGLIEGLRRAGYTVEAVKSSN